MNRYESIASDIASMIRSGTLRTGDHAPSLRTIRERYGVSMMTAQSAYAELERLGLLVSVPRSGFVVKSGRQAPSSVPATPSGIVVSDSRMQADVIREFYLGSHQPDAVPLGALTPAPHLFPVSEVTAALRKVMRERPEVVGKYHFGPGDPLLRAEIARRLAGIAGAVVGDDVITTHGAIEAVRLSLLAVCRPGDSVAVESPCYYGFLQLLESMGLNAVELPSHSITGVDAETVRRALDRHDIRACLFISNYHNPTGSVVPASEKEKIVKLLSSRGVVLVEDDVYGDTGQEEMRLPCYRSFDTDGTVMFASSTSKSITPDLRVGWSIPGRFYDEVLHLKMIQTVAGCVLNEMAVAEYLMKGSADRHLRRLRRTFASSVAAYAEAVREFFPAGTRVANPRGSFFLWVQCPNGTDMTGAFKELLNKGIAIAPGQMFSSRGDFRSFVRLNCGYPPDRRMINAVAEVGKAAAKFI